MTLSGDPLVEPLVEDSFSVGSAVVSPDGRWLAYSSDESGQLEVYVQPLSGPGERRQVSTNGGRQPVWNPVGGGLFFFAQTDELMEIQVGQGTEWEATIPTVVVRSGYAIGNRAAAATYDVSPDGQRFLMIKNPAPPDSGSSGIIVVQNWFSELQGLVSAN